jgi:hypothetical protein
MQPGEQNRVRNEGSPEQEDFVRVEKPFVHEPYRESHHLEEDIFFGEWHLEIEHHSRGLHQEAGNEVP